jgi:glycine/D-amino acid oxidase-like deaminating enzyme
VVIGAGVVGASVAARLAGSGTRVTLLDQDQPGRATSQRSFAWLNSNDKSPRPYHDLNHAGMRAWAELAPHLDGATWYRPVGNIELATSPAAQAELAARVRRLTSWNYGAYLIDPAEAVKLEPSLRLPEHEIKAAAGFPGEGYVLTGPLIARLVARAESLGAEVLSGEQGRVVALRTDPAASLQVRTAAGPLLAADDVICCAGRWTPALAALAVPSGPHDLIPLVPWDTPGATAPGLIVQVGPVTPLAPTRMMHAPGLSLRPHSDGLMHLEAPDATVDLHTPDPVLRRWAGELLRRAQRTVRGLEKARVAGYHVCVRPIPVDHQSIVGPLPAAPGLYVAVTHSAVTLAAHLAELIAADLTPVTPVTPVTPPTPATPVTPASQATAPSALAPYRPARFTRDQAPEPG